MATVGFKGLITCTQTHHSNSQLVGKPR